MPDADLTRRSTPSQSYQPLVVVLAAVAAGIVLDHLWPLGWWLWASLGFSALAFWCLLARREYERVAMVCLALALMAVGGAWHHVRYHQFAPNDLGLFARSASEPVCLKAVALEAPRRLLAPPANPMRTIPTGERSRLEVAVTKIRDGRHWHPADGKITLLVDGHLLGVEAGDHLEVFGQLRLNSAPANPGEMDYAVYNRREGRLCVVRSGFPESVRVVDSGGVSFRRTIDRTRMAGTNLLRQYVGPNHWRLANAMFLGVREDLEPEQSQAFLETGTIHLLVISGLNVGILAFCLMGALRLGLMSAQVALPLIAVLTGLYAVVTDAQPPVVRATVMVIVFCAAMLLNRHALALNSWAAAALVVLAINPSELFDSGAQLSFLCVAVLIWLGQRWRAKSSIDPLDRLIARTRPWPQWLARRLGDVTLRAFVSSAVVWLVVCPLVMARFHLASPIAVLLGPLVAVPTTIAMGTGFALFGVGGGVPLVTHWIGRVCEWNLSILHETLRLARELPGSHAWVAGPADWWLIGFYGLLAAGLVGLVRLPRRWWGGCLAGWCAVGLALSWITAVRQDALQCTFVAVGHGSAVVLRLPGGKTLLYDAGRMGSPETAERAIASVLWSQGIQHLDAVIISHADADHYNALPGLLNKFSIGIVYVSPMMFDRETPALTALRRSIEQHGVPLAELIGGDRLQTGDACQVEVFHPSRRGALGSDNANSIVLGVDYQGRRILLTGDLERPGLDDLLAEQPFDVDILLAPHHGSRFSDPPGMANWATPQWIVISGGEEDRSAEVENAYAQRGCQVLHMATTGAVLARLAADGVEILPYRQGLSSLDVPNPNP